MTPVLVLALCVACAAGCSVAQPRGLTIDAVQATSTAGSLLLTMGEYANEGGGALHDRSNPPRVLLDVSTGSLTAAPSSTTGGSGVNFDFGTESEMSVYGTLISVGDSVLLNGHGLVNASFSLPGLVGVDGVGWDANTDMWFYSAARGRYLFSYHSDAGLNLVVCTAPGACAAPVPSGTRGYDYYDDSRAPVVYDAVSLVKFPLMCCVCLDYAYARFDDTSLDAVTLLNSLHPKAFDASDGVLYSASTSYDPPKTFTVESYTMADATSNSLELSEADFRAVIGGAPIAPAVIAAIAGAAVVGALLLVGLPLFLLYRRRRPPAMKEFSNPKAAVGS